MPKSAPEILLSFPPRPLLPDERALVQEWLTVAGDIALAYVSERRSDDPALYRRIVISCGPTDRPSHIVHAPSGMALWLVTSIGPPLRVEQFDTLRDALSSIRPALG